MNPIKEIMQGYAEGRTRKVEKERKSKENALRKEYNERIQAKEFDGRMYISVDGIPLVEADDIRNDLVETIQKIRQTIIAYKTR